MRVFVSCGHLKIVLSLSCPPQSRFISVFIIFSQLDEEHDRAQIAIFLVFLLSASKFTWHSSGNGSTFNASSSCQTQNVTYLLHNHNWYIVRVRLGVGLSKWNQRFYVLFAYGRTQLFSSWHNFLHAYWSECNQRVKVQKPFSSSFISNETTCQWNVLDEMRTAKVK